MAFNYPTYHIQPTSSPSPPRHHHHSISNPSSPASATGIAVDWADAADYLSSDLDIDVDIDISFASTMSINSAPNSPTRTTRDLFAAPPSASNNVPFSPAESLMDISPAVPTHHLQQQQQRKQHPQRIAQPFLGVSNPTKPSSSLGRRSAQQYLIQEPPQLALPTNIRPRSFQCFIVPTGPRLKEHWFYQPHCTRQSSALENCSAAYQGPVIRPLSRSPESEGFCWFE